MTDIEYKIKELAAQVRLGVKSLEDALFESRADGEACGYDKGTSIGYLQHVDETEWRRNAQAESEV